MHAHLATSFLYALCATAGAAELNVTAPCTPGVSFWSLLGAVDVGYADGRLRMDKLYAVCLPPPKTPSESNYAFSPEGGGKLATLVKDAQGQTLATYVWYAENISGLWELSNYKVLGGFESLKPLAPGAYALEFVADGTPFYRFPFEVSAADSDDPYQAPGKRYFIGGAWNDYGNIFYQRNDPESSVRFTVWVQDKATHAPQQTTPYRVELVRERDGKVLGRDEGELRADTHWKQLDVSFRPSDGDAAAFLKARDLLAQDGAYRVRLSQGGKLYGSYAFAVSGGKIQLQGRQLESTAPLDRIVDYLYGGRYRSWWIARTADVAIAP